MHFGIHRYTIMNTKERIEQFIISELKGICTNCLHASNCVYHQTSTKRIIQCELYELDHEITTEHQHAKGLCATCDSSPRCKLIGRKFGVWNCNEYK